ncbi:hypothetical protein GCM10010334_75070 [Streptomyces finlayi]|uniref:Uncharacterized protein n=1 Tax=Streptomyces finlayi TaxID=67296 RepID=A0A919CE94_9ACTN|nr:hypothetical protein GCM10010334_75070 [Streptomyces finlayi]
MLLSVLYISRDAQADRLTIAAISDAGGAYGCLPFQPATELVDAAELDTPGRLEAEPLLAAPTGRLAALDSGTAEWRRP